MDRFFNTHSLWATTFFNLQITAIFRVSGERVSDLHNIDRCSTRLVFTSVIIVASKNAVETLAGSTLDSISCALYRPRDGWAPIISNNVFRVSWQISSHFQGIRVTIIDGRELGELAWYGSCRAWKTISNIGWVICSPLIFGDRYQSGYLKEDHCYGVWHGKSFVRKIKGRSRWQFCNPWKILSCSALYISSPECFENVMVTKELKNKLKLWWEYFVAL